MTISPADHVAGHQHAGGPGQQGSAGGRHPGKSRYAAFDPRLAFFDHETHQPIDDRRQVETADGRTDPEVGKGGGDDQPDRQAETGPVSHVVEHFPLGGRAPALRGPAVEQVQELPQKDQPQSIDRRPAGKDHPASGEPAHQVHQAQDVGVPVVGDELEGRGAEGQKGAHAQERLEVRPSKGRGP